MRPRSTSSRSMTIAPPPTCGRRSARRRRRRSGRNAQYRMISPSYVRTFGVPLIAGRSFDDHDTARSEPVVLISRTLAQRYWTIPGAVGKSLIDGGFRRAAPRAHRRRGRRRQALWPGRGGDARRLFPDPAGAGCDGAVPEQQHVLGPAHDRRSGGAEGRVPPRAARGRSRRARRPRCGRWTRRWRSRWRPGG